MKMPAAVKHFRNRRDIYVALERRLNWIMPSALSNQVRLTSCVFANSFPISEQFRYRAFTTAVLYPWKKPTWACLTASRT